MKMIGSLVNLRTYAAISKPTSLMRSITNIFKRP